MDQPTTPIEWLLGDDTGVSSKTICAVMTGSRISDPTNADVPHDRGDFGRCHRLLELFPEWRTRLPEVSARFPEWTGLVREWAKLTELYLAAQTGESPRMYKRMRELIDEASVAETPEVD